LTAVIVAVGVVVVLGGGLMASNMGFKLNKSLVAAGGGSLSGTQMLGLPYNRQVGIDNASDLFADMGGSPTVQSISKFTTINDGLTAYTVGLADFPLEAGAGYLVKMGSNSNYIVVGSHDPSAVIQLEAAGAASLSGTNLFTPPYHATASTASELFAELGNAPTVQSISKFTTSNDGLTAYTVGLADFDLNPGESYLIKMGSTVPYSPSHY
jgi:hypothetical protein